MFFCYKSYSLPGATLPAISVAQRSREAIDHRPIAPSPQRPAPRAAAAAAAGANPQGHRVCVQYLCQGLPVDLARGTERMGGEVGI